MDGILVVDKPIGITSRDVVNRVCKILNTKKIGHTGTLDPLAQGVLVLCVGKATKLVELLTCNDKEYVANVKVGVLTDSLDTDGKLLESSNDVVDKEKLANVINNFKKTYTQEAPIYSAIKLNGKKLYEYARENIKIDLPKRKVTIKDIKLLESNNNSYKFYSKVSKGTYIRSLIRDINNEVGIIGVMDELVRTKQGIFDIKDSYTLEDIENNNYKLISINEILKEYYTVNIDDELFNKIKNGAVIENIYNEKMVVFTYNDNVIAIYEPYNKDTNYIKPYRMFI